MLSPWPYFSKSAMQVVAKVLESGKVNYLFGELGQEFEKRFSLFSDSRYSLAVANGTLALDLSLRALNLRPGD